MPDTKNGRERKGRNKRSQLQEELYEEEIEALDADEELPSFEPSSDRPFVADELPDET
ncbi:hypothetical protein [Halobellus limi]|jgi:hypothetical protein|uniref:Uncharacterized protein n=1 Tax=Halobellus limi TaxID=699433 RepID=A0A1H5YF26_9EURY|nr:hypothetical protein [Halobellus limi]SEG22227.1 hypothetical protein SAMN04488133_1551 [Halobellus limi]